MSRLWLDQTERGTYVLVKAIRWIAIWCGRRFTRMFLYPIVLYFYCTARLQREASREYLEKVFGTPPKFRAVFKHFHMFASTIVDRVYFLTNRFDKFEIEIDDQSPMLKYIAQKRGCILLGAHIGSFEVMRALAASRKTIPIKILMNQGHNNRITALLHALNPAILDTLIPMTSIESIMQIKEQIEQGAVIGILGDRAIAGAKSAKVEFLGTNANIPIGPLLIASILKTPVIVCYGIYLGKNKYLIKLDLFSEEILVNRANRTESLERWVRQYASNMESIVKQYPYNWFNYYPFWNQS